MRRLFASERSREVTFAGFLVCFLLVSLLAAEAAIRLGAHNILRAEQGPLREAVALYLRLERAVGIRTPEVSTYRLRPDSTFEGVRINALGLRGPDPADPKPQDRVRIATLGNSTVLGLELSEAETIPAQLAARLSERNPACSFDYVSVSGPGYDHSDLMWLMAHVVDAADFDHVVIIHAGPGHDAARTADWPFLERFRLYWEWQNSLQRQIRENGGRTAAARTASLIERERSALEQIVQSAPGADIWYHTFTGFEHDRQDNLRSLWRRAAAETLSRRDNTGFSTSLDDIPPTQDYFLSPYHYTPKGAAMAAGLIADNIFEVYPEQNALCR